MTPIVRPGKILAIGRNYVAHAKELGNAVPSEPILFLKPPSALIGPGEAIVLPRGVTHVEHEGEIAVVVGRRLRHASREEAEAAIGGFTCANDVTSRALQKLDGQWTRAKGFDTFCPVGPRVADGLDWRALSVSCRVNGEVRQQAPATEMAFDIPSLLAFASGVMTLEPGDLLLTGTPSGTSELRPGDVVEVEIPGVGVLSNPVIAAA
jgi:2-keto-4-pentenoate hydratase/2-oxohepta-3-ene-1,7-dioic acid hydratase in catechol pathway